MKKICLILAMLLCLVPVLASCGANSSAEKAAVAAFEAKYVDFDYEAYFEVDYTCNLELVEDVLDGNDKLDEYKTTVRETKESVKETIKNYAKAPGEYEDYDVEYEVRYCISYEKDSDRYDSIVKNYFEFQENDTDFKDLIEEVAIVGIAVEVYTTDDEDVDSISGAYMRVVCFNIDGDWYVGDFD